MILSNSGALLVLLEVPVNTSRLLPDDGRHVYALGEQVYHLGRAEQCAVKSSVPLRAN